MKKVFSLILTSLVISAGVAFADGGNANDGDPGFISSTIVFSDGGNANDGDPGFIGFNDKLSQAPLPWFY